MTPLALETSDRAEAEAFLPERYGASLTLRHRVRLGARAVGAAPTRARSPVVSENFQFCCSPPVARLRAVGELDLATRDRLRDVLGCLRFRGCTQVEVDLAAVTFIDACTLRVLHAEQRRLLLEGGSLEVVAASAFHQFVARLAGYEALLAPEVPPASRAPSGSRARLRILREVPPLRLEGRVDPASPTPQRTDGFGHRRHR